MKKSRSIAAAMAAVCIGVVSIAGTTVSSSAAPAPAKKPYRIGVVNMDKGAIAYPGYIDGIYAGAQYVNKHGGINGRAIQIVACSTDSTPESNQRCGQQFANDRTLNMVLVAISLSSGPLYEALKPSGVPVAGIFPLAPSDYSAPNVSNWLYGGGASTYWGQAETAKILKPKTISYITQDVASGINGLKNFALWTKDIGAKLTSVVVPGSTTDVIPALTQSGALTADMVIISQANCLPYVKALKQLGARGEKMTVGSCVSPAAIQANPGLFEGWRVANSIMDPLIGKGVSPQMDLFLTEYPKYAVLPLTGGIPTGAPGGWGSMLTLQKALLGKPDTVLNNYASTASVLHSFRGPVNMGMNTLQCGAYPTEGSALCTMGSFLQQFRGTKMVITGRAG